MAEHGGLLPMAAYGLWRTKAAYRLKRTMTAYGLSRIMAAYGLWRTKAAQGGLLATYGGLSRPPGCNASPKEAGDAHVRGDQGSP